ncbi:hypothetical protein [Paractinoplanes rishiriensis]|uniref:Phosphoribosylanthranilate isomerase n=1 Tax=Paractinoplanes rishiriensis TaxID=1050105 RepID=A0A919KBD5_9ACTN|nr:hypothetical protein [Actinoplanes rishiriensis]GIF02019.1 hypothetical protein Ari01nite_94830 [Actinoplanes rishiriensis]
MTNKLIKVDRVRSAGEAREVEALGAGLVGVQLATDPRFADDRAVTVLEAAAIGRELRRAGLVLVMELRDAERVRDVIAETGATLVQPIIGVVPPAEVRAAVRDAGAGIVYGGVEIAHDDDPGWVLSRYTDTPGLDAALFQADVLTEYRDSWAFLRDRAPEFDDEFQIDDLNDLARKYPLLVGLDFTPANVGEIAAALPDVRGFVLTIADQARRGDARCHPYAAVLDVLRAF